jgi:outer membrane protein
MMTRYPAALRRSVVLTALVGVAAWASPAQAQSQNLAQNDDRIVLGAGVSATPAYQGSKDTRIIPLPAIDIKQGWFFANLRNGIGVAPISTDNVDIGASVVFVQGYRQKDVPTGIDRLKDGVGVRLFTNIRAGGFVATLGAVKTVSGGTKGLVADASLSYPIKVSSSFTLTPTVGTTWANGKYNNRYFGVTSAESAASGLAQFTTGSGFKDVSGTLTASYRLSERITLSATGGVTSLVGKVKNSPLVEKKTQPLGLFTLTYRLR